MSEFFTKSIFLLILAPRFWNESLDFYEICVYLKYITVLCIFRVQLYLKNFKNDAVNVSTGSGGSSTP
jgi:hypothetical protein